MSEDESSIQQPRRRPWLALSIAIAIVIVLGAGGTYGWQRWQKITESAAEDQAQMQANAHLLQDQLQAVRNSVDATQTRVQAIALAQQNFTTAITQLNQRNALLEQHVEDLSKREENNVLALHQQEAQMLLRIGQERVLVVGDLQGARQAYALAAQTLKNINSTGMSAVRETLALEQQQLNALPALPQHSIALSLQEIEQQLRHLPVSYHDSTVTQSQYPQAADNWWQRLLAPLVRITPSHGDVPLTHVEQMQIHNAVSLEFSVARSAVERCDAVVLRLSLEQIMRYAQQIWPPSPARAAVFQSLNALEHTPLQPELPLLGSTLTQLQSLR